MTEPFISDYLISNGCANFGFSIDLIVKPWRRRSDSGVSRCLWAIATLSVVDLGVGILQLDTRCALLYKSILKGMFLLDFGRSSRAVLFIEVP